ncbi:transposase family protein [Pilimelia columellifera]|uniref:H repeat-associated protein N-terminal domain-containing protein n=1 Tax=Pilimelia columellifera subsp. columellifera TaxID=706583 RepID=A0ABN3NS32_9ACTN
MSASHAPVQPVIVADDLSGVGSLYCLFSQVTDPRKPRGVRHAVAAVLTLMVLAVLRGATNLRQAGDRTAEPGQDVLSTTAVLQGLTCGFGAGRGAATA